MKGMKQSLKSLKYKSDIYLLTEGLNIGACFGEAALFMPILLKDALSLIKQFGSTEGRGDKVLGELVIPGFLKGKEMFKYIPLKLSNYRKLKSVHNVNIKHFFYHFLHNLGIFKKIFKHLPSYDYWEKWSTSTFLFLF